MSKQIWKYSVGHRSLTPVMIPRGGIVRSAVTQGFTIVIMVEVDPDEPYEERYFSAFGSGRPLEVDGGAVKEYVGTVQDVGGYVWHVYEMNKIWARESD